MIGGIRRWLPAWHTRDRKTYVVFWSLTTLAILLAVVLYTGIFWELRAGAAHAVNRLFLFWSWSKFIHAVSPAVLIYNPHVLYAFEHSVVSARAVYLPFAYPPTMLLLIWPLAALPPAVALVLWLGVSGALYAWACWHRPWGPLIALLALAAPSTLAAMFYGEVSLLVAACIIGGCRLVGRRPILAGVLFGLAAVKPQFGLLVPVALLSAREWRCLIAATMTVGLTAAMSGVAFGWAAWLDLPASLAALS
ncbi:MAG: glycosyltransferase family 87 protein, partial [Acetobacteraceae bacterium]